MLRFLAAGAVSTLLFFCGLAVLAAGAIKVPRLWRDEGFLAYPHAILAAFLCLAFAWFLAIESPRQLFYAKPKTWSPRIIAWYFATVFGLTLLTFLLGGPTNLEGLIVWAVACSLGYWAASHEIDMPAVQRQARAISGWITGALAVAAAASLTAGSLNFPSPYSGRRLIELSDVYGKAFSIQELEYLMAVGMIVFGVAALVGSIAVATWLIASRKRDA